MEDITRPCDFNSPFILVSFIERISFNASLVVLNLSYWILVSVEVHLYIFRILEFFEFSKLFLKVTWHCVKREDGRIIPNPNFFFVSWTISSVPDIGISNHNRRCFEMILSTLFLTHVIDKSATVKCQLSFERTKRW